MADKPDQGTDNELYYVPPPPVEVPDREAAKPSSRDSGRLSQSKNSTSNLEVSEFQIFLNSLHTVPEQILGSQI